MPITSFSSWVPTMRDFRLHWEAVNQQAGGNELELPGGYTVTNFAADETGVTMAMTGVTLMATAVRVQADQLMMDKMTLRERISQFRMAVQLNLPGSRFSARTPTMPGAGAIETRFMEPFDAMSELWAEINGATNIPNFSPPLVLPDNYEKPAFDLARSSLRAGFAQYASTDRELGSRRAERNAVMTPMYERMKQYRTAVQLFLPKGDPLLQTIPKLTPPPGSTPPGLQVLGMWNATLSKAVFSWEQSTFKDIDKIQVRGCPSGSYKNSDEEIVADLPATATSFETDWGLTAAGSLATFKFYVMATTGNENGGKAVKIVRPTT